MLMTIDNLTLAAIIISVILVIVTLMLATHNKKNEQKMRRMAHQMMLMNRNEKAHALCKKIQSISPDLCAGLDFTLKENGDDVEIDTWDTHHPKPNA